MSATFNNTAREGWRKIAESVREPLREQMRTNLGSAGDLDAWVRRTLDNNVGRSSDRAPGMAPLRRIGEREG